MARGKAPTDIAAATMSLADECRPRTSLGCLYSETEIACVREWLASGATGPALATAVPGSGLTTLVTLLVAEAGLDPVWIGCATPRIKSLLERAGSNAVSVTLRRKIIVVDEFDALSSTDSQAAADVLAFAKSSPPLPVLLASHATRSQKTHEFAKSWPKFPLGRPSPARLTAYLTAVAARHGIAAPAVDDIARRTKGDLRAALMALDLARVAPSTVAAAPPDTKDEAEDALDLADAVLRGQRGHTVQDCMKLFAMEPAVVPMGVYENYLASLGKDDLEAARRAAEGFSDADRVDRYMYARQAWDLMDNYGVNSVAVPVLSMRRYRVSKPSQTLGITKFGSLWSKVYNMCAKIKHVKHVSQTAAEAGVRPLVAADLAWVRHMLRSVVGAKAATDADIRAACWPYPPPMVLHIARLDPAGSAAWYKQAVHARVKRALAPP